MSYIGKTPTSVPLTSSDITDGIISTAKIADANVTKPKLTSGSQQNFRNIVINGDMSLAQRGTSASGLTNSAYRTCDRWYITLTSFGTWTASQDTDVPTGQGFAKSLKMDCTTANGSLSSNSVGIIEQRFEGQNLQYLKKGTSSAVSTTVSFWVKSTKTGTFICELDDITCGNKWVEMNGCVACHSLTGEVIVGPSWLGLYGSEVPLDDGTTVTANEEYIRNSILQPASQVHEGFNGNLMPPSFGDTLSAEQIDQIIAFIQSIK